MKLSKRKYMLGFIAAVTLLAIVRCAFPAVAGKTDAGTDKQEKTDKNGRDDADGEDAKGGNSEAGKDSAAADSLATERSTRFYNADGTLVKHRIYSVQSFQNTFADINSLQLEAAERYGVSPVTDRKDAERRMRELVYIGANPYYHVDKLNNSIPYLVPRAAILLQDIGRTFFDSLQVKGIPLHKIIVTSVLRSKADVDRLRSRNGNATVNSCHLYGTTFDICYNRYETVEDPAGPARRKVRNDTLKWVLSEVLRDFRQQQRCYIKYEVHQGCFHLTVN